MEYVLAWSGMYFALVVQAITRYRGRFFLLGLLACLALLAFLRGDVGTDTANYERMLSDYGRDFEWDGREPGFIVLGWSLAILSPTVEIAVRTISLVFFSVVAIYALRADRNERFLLLAYLMPAFAYQYSMNALRLGLASAILLIAAHSLIRRQPGPAAGSALLALMFHYSSAFSITFLVISQRSWRRVSTVLGVGLLMAAMAAAMAAMEIYFGDKMAAYRALQAPGALSGLSKVLTIVVFLLGLSIGALSPQEKLKLGILGAVVTAFGWGLTQYSYAGLRVLDLVSFIFPVSILITYSRAEIEFDWKMRGTIIVAGLVAITSIFRGFLREAGQGSSPFLPYDVRGLGIF